MRIAYVSHWDPFREDGVLRKMRSQGSAWEALGADVEFFCLGRELDHGGAARLPGQRFLFRRGISGRSAATLRLARAVGAWRPELVYLRYSLFLPPPVHLIRRFPTVIEINSDDRVEYGMRSRALGAYNELNRRALFSAATGFAFVTEELAQLTSFGQRDKRRCIVTNGIDLDDATPLPPAANTRPRLVFLGGTADSWHGVDKMIRLAAMLPEFDFDLIGCTDIGPTPANVRVHSFLERTAYEKMLATADVAIGTLALHRKSMSEAAPLKVREYLSRGIPVIVAYDDPDLRDEPWFVLRLPNTERNVEASCDRIREYVSRVRGQRIDRADVAGRIDIAAKEATRLAFFGDVVVASDMTSGVTRARCAARR